MTDLTCEYCGWAVIEDGQTVTCDTRHPCPGCGVTWLVTWCSETEPVLMHPECPECAWESFRSSDSGNAICTSCGWFGVDSRPLRVGDIIETSYGTGPYVVTEIRHFDCDGELMCITCAADDGSPRWLNCYDPHTLRSRRPAQPDDAIIIIGHRPDTQLALL